MKKFWLLLITPFAVLLLVGVVGAYVYDSSHRDLVAEGVSAGGVDLGGMRVRHARTALARGLQKPLSRPVTVRHGKRTFHLSPKRAGLRTDVDGMVTAALAKSREGIFLTRAVRDVTAAEVNADIPVRATYSRRAIEGFVDEVKAKVDRPARDAHLDFSSGRLSTVAERNGTEVRGGELKEGVSAALRRSDAARTVHTQTRTLKPKVYKRQLASKYPTLLVVNRNGFELLYYRRLKLAQSYTVAIGQSGYDTPAGFYNIQTKEVNPAWHVPNSSWAGGLAGQVIPGGASNNPLRARWMGIADGAGIHGTNETGSLGSAASHGCIRMSIPEVIELYRKVRVGTPIYIA